MFYSRNKGNIVPEYGTGTVQYLLTMFEKKFTTFSFFQENINANAKKIWLLKCYSFEVCMRSDLIVNYTKKQCWASDYWIRIRILLSLSKNSKKNLDFYCFVTSF